MSLGAGIFLSAIFLGLIALFIATRGQWNWGKIITWPWKKIVIRAGIVIASLVLLTGIVLGGRYIYLKIAERPKVQKSFWGLTLDSTKEDIKFLKGTPTTEKKDSWDYWVIENTIDIEYSIQFANTKIWAISAIGTGPTIQNIGRRVSYDEVIRKFGKPSYISYSKNGLIRILSFKKYNVFFALEKGSVISLGIYNPSFGTPRFEEEAFVTKSDQEKALDMLHEVLKDSNKD
jgi:hypothetical protein